MKPSTNLAASGFMMLSMMGFVVNDLFIKSLGTAIGTGQVMLLRGLFLTALIVLMLWRRNLLQRVREIANATVITRSVIDAFSTLLFLNALVRLPFANISALLQFLPMAVTLGAWIFYGEQVGWRRWTAIAFGLLGVLIIIQPGFDGFSLASLLMIGTVICAAARDLLTRSVPTEIPSLLITFATVIATTVMGLSMMLWRESWQSVAPQQWAVFVVAAFFLFFGHHFVVLAMRQGDIAYVAPFRYTGLVMGIVLAYLFFDEVPDVMTVIGSVIVVATGLYTMYREYLMQNRQAH